MALSWSAAEPRTIRPPTAPQPKPRIESRRPERPKIRVSMASFPLIVEARRTGAQLAQRDKQLQRWHLDPGQLRECQGRIEHAVDFHRPPELQVLQDAG